MSHSSGYGEAEIQFVSGHKLVDNKVGDFDFICPIVGAKVCFVPIMLGVTLCETSVCPHCKEPIGERI